jgi:hypothetical protein
LISGFWGVVHVGGGGAEFLEEGFGAVVAGEGFADLVVEVALAFDVGVLEGVAPCVELLGAGFGEGEEGGNLGVEVGEAGAVEAEMELRMGFAGRAAGDVEEHEEFGGGAAFEAFGDVVGDGEGGAAELVGEVAGFGEGGGVGEIVDAEGEVEGGFPDGEVFEVLVGHGGSFRISDL